MPQPQEQKKGRYQQKLTPVQMVITGVGLALCAVLLFLLICNLTIIIKGASSPEKPPAVLGITPMVVLSGSMSGDAEGHIEEGDLILVGRADPENLHRGDVISFVQDGVVVTHRIIDVNTDDSGSRLFTTKGDANNAPDEKKVEAEDVIGIYKLRIPKMGDFALFLQTPLGMLLFAGVPVLGFVVYDMIRRQRYAVRKERQRAERMKARLERMEALGGRQTTED